MKRTLWIEQSILCSMGYMVMISNFKEYYKLVDYLSEYTKKQLGKFKYGS